MINQLIETPLQCPYCGETFTILVDGSIESQEYIEDCAVCCRPIDLAIRVDDQNHTTIEARQQNE